MEKHLNLISMLSLQETTLRRVAVSLWSTPYKLLSFKDFRFRSSMPCDHLNNWRECVSYGISKLHLPESIEKQIKRITRPVGLQILRWELYHEAYFNSREFYDLPILEKLQWTAAGTIDYRKTAQELVRCEVLDVVKRYKLACLYCLDHYIPEIWQNLPEACKINFCSEEASPITEPLLHYFWPYILKGEEYKLDGVSDDSIAFNQFAFQFTSSQGNEAAAKYFFQKLSLEEREASLIRAANSALESRSRYMNTYPSSFPNAKISDVVFYLLSEMTPEQQNQIFRERPADVLGCFSDWPWQDAFSGFADTLWTWMQCEDLERRERNYDIVLDSMQRCIQNSDYYVPDLYQNYFMSCPTDFRKHFAEVECSFGTFFPELFHVEDKETIRVILNNLDAGDRLRIASSRHILNLFYNSISRGRGHVVEVFLLEVGLSQEDKVSMKENFMELLKRWNNEPTESETPKWKRIFEFLN